MVLFLFLKDATLWFGELSACDINNIQYFFLFSSGVKTFKQNLQKQTHLAEQGTQPRQIKNIKKDA